MLCFEFSAIAEMRTENEKSQTNPEEYLSNPLNSFALIRRMHEDWVNWELYLRSPVGEGKQWSDAKRWAMHECEFRGVLFIFHE